MPVIVENLSESEEKRGKLIRQIQDMFQQGVGIREIARRTGKNRNTVRKYIEGEPDILCRSNASGMMAKYDSFIIEELQKKIHPEEVIRRLKQKGYSGSDGNARQYIKKLSQKYGIEVSKYKTGGNSTPVQKGTIAMGDEFDYITCKGVFNHLWMGIELTAEHKAYLFNEYPILYDLDKCIKLFRSIFEKKNMNELYLYIETYSDSEMKEIASFAKGLLKDINAVENAVASELSNGFVEGFNNKLKMVKRTMYGRGGRKLLSAKLMYAS